MAAPCFSASLATETAAGFRPAAAGEGPLRLLAAFLERRRTLGHRHEQGVFLLSGDQLRGSRTRDKQRLQQRFAHRQRAQPAQVPPGIFRTGDSVPGLQILEADVPPAGEVESLLGPDPPGDHQAADLHLAARPGKKEEIADLLLAGQPGAGGAVDQAFQQPRAPPLSKLAQQSRVVVEAPSAGFHHQQLPVDEELESVSPLLQGVVASGDVDPGQGLREVGGGDRHGVDAGENDGRRCIRRAGPAAPGSEHGGEEQKA